VVRVYIAVREIFESSSSSKAELKVLSMAKQEADKSKAHGHDKEKQAKPKSDTDKDKKKAEKAMKDAEAMAAASAAEKAPEAPRPPADPRLKFMKKFHGKFLPRGPLRDRHKALMVRWDSGEDHGGVTVDELKSLYTDWKSARTKPVKAAKA
jgi:hypothetical protein